MVGLTNIFKNVFWTHIFNWNSPKFSHFLFLQWRDSHFQLELTKVFTFFILTMARLTIFSWNSPKFSHFLFLQWWDSPFSVRTHQSLQIVYSYNGETHHFQLELTKVYKLFILTMVGLIKILRNVSWTHHIKCYKVSCWKAIILIHNRM
jgi:hypothetical protein